jgi:murein DD-endopeptidase MepM/ murein hydrolase activator NlpD
MSKSRKIPPFFIFILPLFLFFFQGKGELEIKKPIYFSAPLTFAKPPSDLPEIVLIEDNFLRPSLPPAFVSGKVLATVVDSPRKEIQEYIVKEGDTLSSIAEKFSISLETIIWTNNLTKNSPLKPGQKLIILPVSGILHQVRAGDTLSEIAQRYQAKIEEIISFNELESPDDIYIGDNLIIPGGKMPPKIQIPSTSSLPLNDKYFICPVAGGCRITQGLHFSNAVDFSNGKCGEPILAAAGGVIQKVKYGWNFGAGNLVTILHQNGIVTLYYHLEKIFVSPGQSISQGEIIGTMGRTGRTTGCHLHFGVYGAKNPFAK